MLLDVFGTTDMALTSPQWHINTAQWLEKSLQQEAPCLCPHGGEELSHTGLVGRGRETLARTDAAGQCGKG